MTCGGVGEDDPPRLPGFPLESGFTYVDKAPGLSPEARKRVNDKIDAVQEARRRAMESWHNYVIG